jgi:Autotransporter beta-domain
VLEPQGQILWQKVSFRHDYDGEGDVALGDTTGPSGRIGLRTKWTIVTAGGQIWEPYLRGNLWRDRGAEANAVFSGTDSVPLVNQATMLEFGGGLTGRINANVSVFCGRRGRRQAKRRSRRIRCPIHVVTRQFLGLSRKPDACSQPRIVRSSETSASGSRAVIAGRCGNV